MIEIYIVKKKKKISELALSFRGPKANLNALCEFLQKNMKQVNQLLETLSIQQEKALRVW